MEWNQQMDGYCERTDFSLWSEPLNALTNLAFIAAALWLWPRVRGDRGAEVLVAVLFLIGIGSGLFHTLATQWAALADVVPIAAFILIYLFLAARVMLRLKMGLSLLVVTAVVVALPMAAVAFAQVPGLGSSAGYAPIPVLILGVALLVRQQAPTTARRLSMGAGLLVVSIILRTLDEPLCHSLATGTHFLWHLLNAAMLAWMIHTYMAHVLAGGRTAR